MIDKAKIMELKALGVRHETIARQLGCSTSYVSMTVIRCRKDPAFVYRVHYHHNRPKPIPGRRQRVIELSRKYQESLNVS